MKFHVKEDADKLIQVLEAIVVERCDGLSDLLRDQRRSTHKKNHALIKELDTAIAQQIAQKEILIQFLNQMRVMNATNILQDYSRYRVALQMIGGRDIDFHAADSASPEYEWWQDVQIANHALEGQEVWEYFMEGK